MFLSRRCMVKDYREEASGTLEKSYVVDERQGDIVGALLNVGEVRSRGRVQTKR